MKPARLCLLLAAAAFAGTTLPAAGATLGLLLDHGQGTAVVFDADGDRIVGSVPVAPGSNLGDCAVSDDQTRGYVSGASGGITVLDLSQPTPTLASGVNPIPHAGGSRDVSLSPDGRYLLACGAQSLSVYDTQQRNLVGSLPLSGGCGSVDACDGGSVLVETLLGVESVARRLTLTADGSLADTGESIPGGNPFCGGGGRAGFALVNQSLISFSLQGMRQLSETGLSFDRITSFSGQSNRAGNRVYVSANDDGRDAEGLWSAQQFLFDPVTGRLGNNNGNPYPGVSAGVSLTSHPGQYGSDLLALGPYGDVAFFAALGEYDADIFVVERPRLLGFDAPFSSYNPRAVLTTPGLSRPGAVCLPRAPATPLLKPVAKALGVAVTVVNPEAPDRRKYVEVSPIGRLEIPAVPPLRVKRVQGKTMYFAASNGDVICSGVTDAMGYARCTGFVGLESYGGIPSFQDARYSATFEGDRTLDFAFTSARMIFPKP